MEFYKVIKITGKEAKTIGDHAPYLYRLQLGRHTWKFIWKYFGFQYVRDRLSGGYIWWTDSQEHYDNAINALRELKKTHDFILYREVPK